MAFGTVQAAVVQVFDSCGNWVAAVVTDGTHGGVLNCEVGFGETQIMHPAAVVTTGVGTVGGRAAEVSSIQAVFGDAGVECRVEHDAGVSERIAAILVTVTAVDAAIPGSEVSSLLTVVGNEVTAVGGVVYACRDGDGEFHFTEIVAHDTGGHVVCAVTGFEFIAAVEVFGYVWSETGEVYIRFTADVTIFACVDRDTVEVTESVTVSDECCWGLAVVHVAGPANLVGIIDTEGVGDVAVCLDVLVQRLAVVQYSDVD